MRRFIVSERSMAPALTPGDCFLARRVRRPRRGTIAFFPHPRQQSMWLVKRVVGLPGETVRIVDGSVLIDGAELDEPWTTDLTMPEGLWTVGSDQMFVLSDARQRTRADSRTLGPVPVRPAYEPWWRYRRGSGVTS